MRKGSSTGGVRHAEGTTNRGQVWVAGRTDSGLGTHLVRAQRPHPCGAPSSAPARTPSPGWGGTQEQPGTAQDGLCSQVVRGEILTEQRPPRSRTAPGHQLAAL